MIKRIIIEGADQQGKSTLCKILQKELNWDVVHFGKPSEDFDFIKGYMIPENTISDRNFMSEIVYSKVVGRQSRAAMTLLSNVFKHNDTLLILLDRENDFIFDESRKEDYNKFEIMDAILIYREEFKKLNMEKMKLNPNSPDYLTKVQSIIDLINEDI